MSKAFDGVPEIVQVDWRQGLCGNLHRQRRFGSDGLSGLVLPDPSGGLELAFCTFGILVEHRDNLNIHPVKLGVDVVSASAEFGPEGGLRRIVTGFGGDENVEVIATGLRVAVPIITSSSMAAKYFDNPISNLLPFVFICPSVFRGAKNYFFKDPG